MDQDRRNFLWRTGMGLAGLTGLGLAAGCSRAKAPTETATQPAAAPPPETPVVPESPAGAASTPGSVPGGVPIAQITHSGVWASQGQLSKDIVLQMIDKGVEQVTGAGSAAAGWKSLFASDDVVAIKVNEIAPHVYTHPVLAMAIAQRLMDIGLRPGNILIYDRNRGELQRNGYEVQEDPSKVVVRGVDREWDDAPTEQGAFSGRLAKIVTKYCSAMVNAPILKHHGGAGVALAMKNHYGSHDNPQRHHRNQCDPYIADLNSIPAIKDKTRLIVCDATIGCFTGGPSPDNPHDCWQPNAVLVATDPVAHDAYGTHLIDEQRRQRGLQATQPRQLASAAARNLGTNDLGRLNVMQSRLA